MDSALPQPTSIFDGLAISKVARLHLLYGLDYLRFSSCVPQI